MINMNGILKNNNCKVIENNLKSRLISKGYGIKKDEYLELNLFESMYLFEKNKMNIILNKKQLTKDKIEAYINKHIKNFKDKYIVYKDFKENGYIIKDGATFGFDFRIYEGNSKVHEHTKYVVDVKRTHKDEMTKIIKSERLASSIKTKYIIAIIDLENKVTKIKLERI
jgi:tRNA-intron endonuclease